MTKYKIFNGEMSTSSGLEELVEFINKENVKVVSINYVGGSWVLIYSTLLATE